jgi:glutaredoxin 3
MRRRPRSTVSPKPILYIKPGCPWCSAALAYFSEHGIELDVRNVNASEADMRRMVEISGQSKTPTFEYGDFVVADFSVDEFLAKLARAPEVQRELGLGEKKASAPSP